ncbi:hypothetical protein [Actinokineospora sp. HUAS TT18]|uniref:hypothetical protein n=1 Tax=Actinokineospora sp. HUAS TT18 TaxID=3447451 RepID=UPI003F51DF08
MRTRLAATACLLLLAGCGSTVAGTAVPAPPRPLKDSIATVDVGEWVDTPVDLRFVVDKIEVDPGCTAKNPLPLKSGRHLVVLTVSVETGPTFAKKADTPVWDIFHVYGPYGFDNVGASHVAPRCLPQEETIYFKTPAPNGKYWGKIVLETTATEGMVVHKNWKWKF